MRDIIRSAFDQISVGNAKLTPYKACKDGGTNYSNFKEALEGKRPFSDEMIRALDKCGFFPLTYIELLSLKLRDEYPLDAIRLAVSDEALSRIINEYNPQKS